VSPDDAKRRGWLLVGGALVAALILVGAYLAAGGASYTPEKTLDPCKPRPWSNPEGLGEIANQFTTSALDGAACKLGVSRERLARALATTEGREKFAKEFHIDDERLTKAIRAGLVRAVDDAEENGELSPLLAGPIRATVQHVPLETGIELVQDAEKILNGESFLGGIGNAIEELLP